jgi:predicted transcriptional regulator
MAPGLFASGGESGRHVLSRLRRPLPWVVASSVVASLLERYRSLDPNSLSSGTHAAIRPPFSPHRSGRGFSLPVDEISLSNLETTATPDAVAELLRALGVDPRGAYVQQMLRYGDTEGIYPSRSEAIRAIAVSYVDTGLPAEHFVADVISSPMGEKARAKRSPARWLHGEYRRAIDFVNRRPAICSSGEFQAAIAEMRHAASRHPWPGRSGSTDRAVHEAILVMAETAGKIHPALSVRDVADRAAVSRSTASNAMHRLAHRGWLGKEHREGVGTDRAHTWMLLRPNLDTQSTHPRTLCDTSVQDALAHDVWRWGRGLGRSAWLVWGHLSPVPTQPRELSQALGRSSSAVRRQLRKLADVGLAVQVAEGWVRGEADLDEVSRALGADGIGRRQAQAHALQRDAHAKWLEARAARTWTHVSHHQGGV